MSNKQKRAVLKAKRVRKRAERAKRRMENLTAKGRVVEGVVIPQGATPADPSQQAPNNSYSTKLYYVDIEFTCVDCGKVEVWTGEQQKWYYEVAKGSIYARAVRCRACRKAHKDRELARERNLSRNGSQSLSAEGRPVNPKLHKHIRSAIKSGDFKQVHSLLSKNEDALEMDTPFGPWLHVAASFGQLEIVKLLPEMGADIHAVGGVYGGTALNYAAMNGHFEVVEHLLDKGAKMDVSAPERNPLFGAIIHDHAAVGKLLIDRGIDMTVKYTWEWMGDMDALTFAEERGSTECVKLLKGL